MTKKQPEAFAMWGGRALFQCSKRSLCVPLSINLPSGQSVSRPRQMVDTMPENDVSSTGRKFEISRTRKFSEGSLLTHCCRKRFRNVSGASHP